MSKRPSKTDRDPSVTESGGDDVFLGRWSRRKRVARSGGDPDANHPGKLLEEELPAEAPPGVDESPLQGEGRQPSELTDEDMPPVDAIDEDTDMSGFFSPKVSQAVKKAALRKFFHSPAFNIVDGLDDYDDDFRTFAALGDIVTSDMRGQMEREAEAARENLAKDGASLESAPSAERADETDGSPDDPMDGLESAKQGARAESDDAVSAPGTSVRAPSQEPGITRDPARHAKAAPGKLRPRSDADESRDGRVRAKQDARADDDA